MVWIWPGNETCSAPTCTPDTSPATGFARLGWSRRRLLAAGAGRGIADTRPMPRTR